MCTFRREKSFTQRRGGARDTKKSLECLVQTHLSLFASLRLCVKLLMQRDPSALAIIPTGEEGDRAQILNRPLLFSQGACKTGENIRD